MNFAQQQASLDDNDSRKVWRGSDPTHVKYEDVLAYQLKHHPDEPNYFATNPEVRRTSDPAEDRHVEFRKSLDRL